MRGTFLVGRWGGEEHLQIGAGRGGGSRDHGVGRARAGFGPVHRPRRRQGSGVPIPTRKTRTGEDSEAQTQATPGARTRRHSGSTVTGGRSGFSPAWPLDSRRRKGRVRRRGAGGGDGIEGRVRERGKGKRLSVGRKRGQRAFPFWWAARTRGNGPSKAHRGHGPRTGPACMEIRRRLESVHVSVPRCRGEQHQIEAWRPRRQARHHRVRIRCSAVEAVGGFVETDRPMGKEEVSNGRGSSEG
jgi:hypothetical protein